MTLDGSPVRFVAWDDGVEPLFYQADSLQARSPLKLEVGDMTGDGQPEILAAPEPWPPFLRSRVAEDTSLAVLGADGVERFRHQSEYSMQEVRLLPTARSGAGRVLMLTADARLRILGADGSVCRDDDLYAMHTEFQRREGRPNTRHPAGGFTMPYSLGLWRPDAAGRYRTVISRYGAYSFLDPAGRFEGLHLAGDYVLAQLLPYGVDFDRDGQDEQLCLGRYALTHLDGDATPRVPDAKGALFFPQVYGSRLLTARGFAGTTVDGVPVQLFAVTAFGTDAPRYVAVVRRSYLALYDGRTRTWAFSWTPVVPIRAAVIADAAADRLEIVLATEENLLWRLRWRDRPDRLESFAARTCPCAVTSLAVAAEAPEALLLAGDEGVYRLERFATLHRLADGAWRAVQPLPAGAGKAAAVVAVTADGAVVRLDRAR